MKNIIGVRFKKPGKIYFFDSGNLEITNRDFVIVETTGRRRIWRSSNSQ